MCVILRILVPLLCVYLLQVNAASENNPEDLYWTKIIETGDKFVSLYPLVAEDDDIILSGSTFYFGKVCRHDIALLRMSPTGEIRWGYGYGEREPEHSDDSKGTKASYIVETSDGFLGSFGTEMNNPDQIDDVDFHVQIFSHNGTLISSKRLGRTDYTSEYIFGTTSSDGKIIGLGMVKGGFPLWASGHFVIDKDGTFVDAFFLTGRYVGLPDGPERETYPSWLHCNINGACYSLGSYNVHGDHWGILARISSDFTSVTWAVNFNSIERGTGQVLAAENNDAICVVRVEGSTDVVIFRVDNTIGSRLWKTHLSGQAFPNDHLFGDLREWDDGSIVFKIFDYDKHYFYRVDGSDGTLNESFVLDGDDESESVGIIPLKDGSSQFLATDYVDSTVSISRFTYNLTHDDLMCPDVIFSPNPNSVDFITTGWFNSFNLLTAGDSYLYSSDKASFYYEDMPINILSFSSVQSGKVTEYGYGDFPSSFSRFECYNHKIWCHGVTRVNTTYVCTGHGECVSHNNCTCESDYIGDECEQWQCFGKDWNDQSVCNFGNGTCDEVNNCNCTQGYYGDECELWDCDGVLYNDTSEVCRGHGKCVAPETCSCSTNYDASIYCDWKCKDYEWDDFLVCTKGNGECLSFDNCYCVDGYRGEECENWSCYDIFVDENSETICGGHGRCAKLDTCFCYGDYTKLHDEICDGYFCFDYFVNDTQNVCSGHGSCTSRDICACFEGYMGDQCQTYSTYQCYGVSHELEESCSGSFGICSAPNVCNCSSTSDDDDDDDDSYFGYFGLNCEIKAGKNLVRATKSTLAMYFEISQSSLEEIYGFYQYREDQEFECSNFIKIDPLFHHPTTTNFFKNCSFSNMNGFQRQNRLTQYLKIDIRHLEDLDDYEQQLHVLVVNKPFQIEIKPSRKSSEKMMDQSYTIRSFSVGKDNSDDVTGPSSDSDLCKTKLHISDECIELFECFESPHEEVYEFKYFSIGFYPGSASKDFYFSKFYYGTMEECRRGGLYDFDNFHFFSSVSCSGSPYGDNFAMYENCGDEIVAIVMGSWVTGYFFLSTSPFFSSLVVVVLICCSCVFNFEIYCCASTVRKVLKKLKKNRNIHPLVEEEEEEEEEFELVELEKKGEKVHLQNEEDSKSDNNIQTHVSFKEDIATTKNMDVSSLNSEEEEEEEIEAQQQKEKKEKNNQTTTTKTSSSPKVFLGVSTKRMHCLGCIYPAHILKQLFCWICCCCACCDWIYPGFWEILKTLMMIGMVLAKEGFALWFASSEFLDDSDIDPNNPNFVLLSAVIRTNMYIIWCSIVTYLFFLTVLILLFSGRFLSNPLWFCVAFGSLKEFVYFRTFKAVTLLWFICINLFCYVIKFAYLDPYERDREIGNVNFWFPILFAEALLLFSLYDVLSYNGVSSYAIMKRMQKLGVKGLLRFPHVKISIWMTTRDVDVILEDFFQLMFLIKVDNNQLLLEEKAAVDLYILNDKKEKGESGENMEEDAIVDEKNKDDPEKEEEEEGGESVEEETDEKKTETVTENENIVESEEEIEEEEEDKEDKDQEEKENKEKKQDEKRRRRRRELEKRKRNIEQGKKVTDALSSTEEYGHLSWELLDGLSMDEICYLKEFFFPGETNKEDYMTVFHHQRITSMKWTSYLLCYPVLCLFGK